ncbi:hypothetical protein CDD81_3482 [Ophiocordyceps australis]|uniref:Uncharacterized protein n=1 Tax=Ophiocordyceps australis TaxID=1399860 RepID=A0A2C5YDN1_9HYPO|nr:hypothetical protein CDD81_3482 [Ophiocordyceps australis]
MIAHYKMHEESAAGPLRHMFSFTSVMRGLVIAYHVVTFFWTITHLHFPEVGQTGGGLGNKMIRAVSLPRNMHDRRKQGAFTMLYSAATTFSFMDTAMYWLITRHHDMAEGNAAMAASLQVEMPLIVPQAPFGDFLGTATGWYKPFVMMNMHGGTSLLMIMEMLLMNSIKHPHSLGAHFLGLIVMTVMYLAWARFGKWVTGQHAYFWLDKDEVGSHQAVLMYSTGFVFMAPLMYTLMHGLTAIRERLTRPWWRRVVRAGPRHVAIQES